MSKKRKGPTKPRETQMELIQRPCCHALGNPRTFHLNGSVKVRHNAPCKGKRKKNIRYFVPTEWDISKELA